MEEIRKQNEEQLGAVALPQDLTSVMELSKRDEEARLSRLREEEEELEKVRLLHRRKKLSTGGTVYFLSAD